MKLTKRVCVLVAAPAVLLSAAPALAQTLYKYERPDGTIVYSDAPVKGARLLERLPAVPVPAEPVPTAPAQVQAPAPARDESTAEAPVPSRTEKLDAADTEVRAALQALEVAKARLEQGAEPLPGERTATVFGTTRLNDGYFARQQALQQDLERANARLDEAYRKRNDAK
jgi:hypothetical protein